MIDNQNQNAVSSSLKQNLKSGLKVEKVRCKKCIICPTKFVYDKNKPFVIWCSPECGFEHARNLKGKQVEKEWKEKKTQLKEKVKTLSSWKADLQTEINAIIRLIDKGCPCIATGSFNGKKNAGHKTAIGANSTIRFHLDNIHIQSEHSNSYKGGDNYRYYNGLEKTYGKQYAEYVDDLNNIKPIHISKEEIKEFIQIARMIVKQLREADKEYDASQRLALRKLYNDMIGIYN